MSVATLEIAQFMGLSELELMRQALATFLQDQRRQVLQIRLELLAPYGTHNVTELEIQIANGDVPEHPAWEDLIVAENLGARLKELDDYLQNL